MKTLIRYGLGAALAGALAFGTALAQGASSQGNPSDKPSAGTGSGAPNSVGAGDTSRTGSSPSTGSGSSSTDTSSGMTGSTGSSDQATGGGGATAGSSSTATGTGSAGKKLSKSLQDKLEKLHADNQAEIQLGQLASQNGQSDQVKQFGQQMQTDHQNLDQKLSDQAQTLGVSLEGKTFQKQQEKDQKTMQKLQSKTGADFDKAYMSQMVKDHKSDAKEVKSARSEAQKQHQTEIASLLQQAENGINGHLHHAQQVEKAVKHEKAGGSASTSTGSSSMGTGSSANQGSQNPAAQPGGAESMHSGSRGDTGGPTPGGKDQSTGSETTPSGGAKGSSSDNGTR